MPKDEGGLNIQTFLSVFLLNEVGVNEELSDNIIPINVCTLVLLHIVQRTGIWHCFFGQPEDLYIAVDKILFWKFGQICLQLLETVYLCLTKSASFHGITIYCRVTIIHGNMGNTERLFHQWRALNIICLKPDYRSEIHLTRLRQCCLCWFWMGQS